MLCGVGLTVTAGVPRARAQQEEVAPASEEGGASAQVDIFVEAPQGEVSGSGGLGLSAPVATSAPPSVVVVGEAAPSDEPVGSAAVYGEAPIPASAQIITPVRRRGDRLSDSANTGEIVDLMITSGGYGLLLANSIVTWSGFDHGASSDDQVRVRFISSLLGASVSLTGLLAVDAPRGVPTTMAMGLRYGTLIGGLLVPMDAAFDGNGLLAGLTLGGVVGLGIGAGLGYGLRPHISRSRFVEAGVPWGFTLGAMVAGAFKGNTSEIMGGMILGTLGAMTAHTIVASLAPVNVGRGWLLDLAFAGGAGIAALFTWGFGGSEASGETYLATMSATGLVALGIVFAVTDGIQDSGWDDDVAEVLSSMTVSAAPTEGGGMAVISGQF